VDRESQVCNCNIDISLLVSAAVLQQAIISKLGVPLAGGVIYFYRQDDMTTLKNVYYQTGTGPLAFDALPNPLVLSASGSFVDVNGADTLPYFYPYLDDCANTGCNPSQQDLYFIKVYDSNMNLQFTRSYFPFGAEGQQPSGLIASLENYISNNRFWRNIGQSQIGQNDNGGFNAATLTQYTHEEYNASGTYYTQRLAPSQHDGFSMPDFRYIRNANTGITEIISFLKFPGQPAPPTIVGDVQPEFYINHTCTSDSSGATLKVYQFPISLHLATLANQLAAFSIQGQSISGNATITVGIYQFNGSGTISPATIPLGDGKITFGSSWEKFELFGIFPPNTNLPTGNPGDDAYYLQIGMPVGSSGAAVCNLNFCLPSLYISDALINIPTNDFQTYDQIDAIIAAPRTGDVKISMNDFYPFGWVPMTGGTLVGVNTVATTVVAPTSNLGIAYQGTDAWPLYNMLWNRFVGFTNGTSNSLAQMYLPAGGVVGYGANAWSDWNALNQLSLSPMIGRILMGTVPPTALPVLYTNTVTAATTTTTVTCATNAGGLLFTSAQALALGQAFQFPTPGGGGALPTGINANTTYYAIPTGASGNAFYVATTLANALENITILGSNTGTATFSITSNIASTSLVLAVSVSPNALNLFKGQIVTFSNANGALALPGGLAANTVYYAAPTGNSTNGTGTFCLATSFSNAMSGNYITYTTSGSGTTIATVSLPGASEGEFAHQQYGAEIGTHYHTPDGTSATDKFVLNTSGSGASAGATSGTPVTNTGTAGAGTPANITQPSIQMNFLIKL
jgi:hypothetical protein